MTVALDVVGAGGVATVEGAVNVTVVGAPWTTGTVSIGTMTEMGGASPLSGTGARRSGPPRDPDLHPHERGRGSDRAGVRRAELHFVPEPTTLGMLGAGIAALLAVGRRRTSA
ncbi:MAG: hypothetical protein DCC71_19435 [Proteobacteria bacterium]|nr:MAG: hypothetical protein DCC71_19435 [Pseudomonadota bacterium]